MLHLFTLILGVLFSVVFWLYVFDPAPREPGMFLLGLISHLAVWWAAKRQWIWSQRNPGSFTGRRTVAGQTRSPDSPVWMWLGVGAVALPLIGSALAPKQTLDKLSSQLIEPRRGDLSKTGGSPTVRQPYYFLPDDPSTTDDESNNQPVGYFGTLTLEVCNESSGNCYSLDADMSGLEVERLYFPKGGWVDFYYCGLDEDYYGYCEDENGNEWAIEGAY